MNRFPGAEHWVPAAPSGLQSENVRFTWGGALHFESYSSLRPLGQTVFSEDNITYRVKLQAQTPAHSQDSR